MCTLTLPFAVFTRHTISLPGRPCWNLCTLMMAGRVFFPLNKNVHRECPRRNLIMKSKLHFRYVWRFNYKDDAEALYDSCTKSSTYRTFSRQQSLTLFSQLIFSLTPTFSSLSAREQQQKLSWEECIHSLHSPFQSLPTFPNDCSPSKLLKKPKHLTSYRNGY